MATQDGNTAAASANYARPEHRRIRRWALWGTAALVLLLPLVAMLFTDEVNWTASDFVFAAILLFGAVGAYEVFARQTPNITYRAGAGLAIAAAVLLTWSNAAVGLTDSAADALYLGVAGVAIIGAVLARLRAGGMARAMLATALAQALVGAGALVAGVVPAHNAPFEVLAITAFFVALWLGSGWLFWRSAASERVEPAT